MVSFPRNWTVFIPGKTLVSEQKSVPSQQVRSDSKNLLSGFVFGIMESLIYLIWPRQIKERVKDARVPEMEATYKSNFFGGGRSRGRHTGGEKKEQRLLETF